MTTTERITISTSGNCDIIDITSEIREKLLSLKEYDNGSVTVFVPGSTGAVTTTEYESGALDDLKNFFDEIIPPEEEYQHNMKWGDGNGHSHLRASLTGPSLTIPIVTGSLTLGTWQQVIFIDFDNRPRTREIIVQFTC